jgi:TIR domain
MATVVISYRRQDSGEITGRIHDHLVHRYGDKSIYMDIASMPAAVDFRDHIREAVERAHVLLAVIGKDWTGPRPGAAPRIFDPDDPVRAEVETALAENVRVMPVQVNGAIMPKEAEVPASLKRLPYLNAIEVKSGPTFHAQIKHLVRSIDRLIAFDRSLYAAKYLALPIFLLLLSDYLLLFKLDLDPISLRVASLLIAAGLGMALFFQVRQRAVRALLLGAAVGLVSVLGMLAINAALSSRSSFTLQAIVPTSTREWQEAVEYLVTITATTFAGNVVAAAVHARKSRAQHEGSR